MRAWYYPRYFQIPLEGGASVWINEKGTWEFGAYRGRPDRRSRFPITACYLDPRDAAIWRRNFEAALAHRAQGYDEAHANNRRY